MKTRLACAGLLAISASLAFAQEGPPAGRGAAPAFPSPVAAYPQRITDPVLVERGRASYVGAGCAGCHDADTRGTDRGPSLLRSQLVQRDQKGELIGPVVRNGVGAMPRTASLSNEQIADIAEFLHSIPLNSRDPGRQRPATIVTGDARRGRTYFQVNCSSCHSATGDMRAIGSKYQDPRTLQGRMLSPVSTQRTTVTVNPGRKNSVSGELMRLDEFNVTLRLAGDEVRSFERNGNSPRIAVHDPLAQHKALLRRYSDRDIHDLTAYLVSLK